MMQMVFLFLNLPLGGTSFRLRKVLRFFPDLYDLWFPGHYEVQFTAYFLFLVIFLADFLFLKLKYEFWLSMRGQHKYKFASKLFVQSYVLYTRGENWKALKLLVVSWMTKSVCYLIRYISISSLWIFSSCLVISLVLDRPWASNYLNAIIMILFVVFFLGKWQFWFSSCGQIVNLVPQLRLCDKISPWYDMISHWHHKRM